MHMKDAILASANAKLQMEADPDRVMSAVLPTFTASQPAQGRKDFTSQFAALKAKARSTPPSFEKAKRGEIRYMKENIAELKDIIMLSFHDE